MFADLVLNIYKIESKVAAGAEKVPEQLPLFARPRLKYCLLA